MDYIFTIDSELDVPLYRQLVDSIQTAIKKGELSSGEKLPTVQEMSQNLSIARGTIKRAYDELERKGLLEKVQGRGTFVCYEPVDVTSRKAQAMAAIDNMLNRLEDMGLSPAEINIFLNLKLRQRAEQDSKVKVVLVEAVPENLKRMEKQLRRIEGVDLYSHLLESLRQYPYKLGDDFDLLVTTPENAEYLQNLLPGNKRVTRVALRPSNRCLTEVIRLPDGANVGILGYSVAFAQQMYDLCQDYAGDVNVSDPVVAEARMDVEGFLREKDAVLVPKGWEGFFPARTREMLESCSGKLIPCGWEMDEGSLLYLETKIKRLMDAKSI